MKQIPQLPRWLPLLALAASLQLTLGYYDPAAQRWINRDPIGEEGHALRRVGQHRPRVARVSFPVAAPANLAGLVQNSPVRFVDPWGLDRAAKPPPPCARNSASNCPKQCLHTFFGMQITLDCKKGEVAGKSCCVCRADWPDGSRCNLVYCK